MDRTNDLKPISVETFALDQSSASSSDNNRQPSERYGAIKGESYGVVKGESYGTNYSVLPALTPGATIEFGCYPQSKEGYDIRTPIQWTILNRTGNSVLMISTRALDVLPYNYKNDSDNWENSSIRTWLNNDFLQEHFSAYEKKCIIPTNIGNGANQGISGWNVLSEDDTVDHVFLLSVAEASRFCHAGVRGSQIAKAEATEFAIAHGDGERDVNWWLRSKSEDSHEDAAFVWGNGTLGTECTAVRSLYIRPAMSVDLETLASEQGSIRSFREEWKKHDNNAALWQERKLSIKQRESVSWRTKATYLHLGTYPQSNTEYQREPIEWIVLKKDGQRVLLLSRYGLDVREFDDTCDNADLGMWELSSMREWLNEDFFQDTFSQEEKGCICEAESDNSISQGCGLWKVPKGFTSGDTTVDKVFLLSATEAFKYLHVVNFKGADGDHVNFISRVEPTAYAKMKGAHTNSAFKTINENNAGQWWLRSFGYNLMEAAIVYEDGSLQSTRLWNRSVCVRPAIWVDIKALMGLYTKNRMWTDAEDLMKIT